MLLIILSTFLILSVSCEPLETCIESRWAQPQPDPPSNSECLAYDGSLIPDCLFFLNNYTSFYHVHEYNCSRFWECSPQGPCLFECADCGDSSQCQGYEGLSFDCRYQYPEGPVCDWPTTVNCTNHFPCEDECCSDEDCPDGHCVDGSCVNDSCSSDSDCTTTSCSFCANNLCQDPACCTNEDCPVGDCVNGECPCDDCEPWQTCDANVCTPECISDEHCPENEWCDTSVGICKPGCRDDTGCTATQCSSCQDHQCSDPQCCSDDDCPDGYCADDGTCAGECDEDSDCISTSCSSCKEHHCVDPQCCSNDDCENGYCNDDGTCAGECDENSDCTATSCSQCQNHFCLDPQCCSDEDCPSGYCDENGECAGECNDNSDCTEKPCSECQDYICMDPACCTDDECPDGQQCTENGCQDKPGVAGLEKITISTASCTGCTDGMVEDGVKLTLIGYYQGTQCTSKGLDNMEKMDYGDGQAAVFDGLPEDDDSDDGLGECKYADLNKGLSGGSATWTGSGTWTAIDANPVCVNFYMSETTWCCTLAKSSLEKDESTDLTNCKSSKA